MTTKYCEPNLYCGAVVVGSISGTTLTVTEVISGTVCVGATVLEAGTQFNNYISANGTGTGGTGTYTMMYSATVASQTLNLQGGVPGNTTWGQAQEGDGLAKGAATPATVSIDLSGATAGAGDTLSIMGAVLTCVASGATTNQFNAGSGATLVSNLVTAINRTTNTAAIAAQDTGWMTPVLQNAVFARVGSPSTTLEIMTRAGSAVYNSSTVAQSGIAGVTGPWTFSGGASGAWGHLSNAHAAAFPSGISTRTYGLWCLNQPTAGAMLAGDVCKVRAKTTVYFNPVNQTNQQQLPATYGSREAPCIFEIDDGTEWPADAPNPVFTIWHTSTGNALAFQVQTQGAASFVEFNGKKYSDGTYNFRMYDAAPTAASSIGFGFGSGCRFSNFLIECVGTGAGARFYPAGASMVSGPALRAVIGPGIIKTPRNNNMFVGAPANGTLYAADFVGVEFDNTGATVPDANVINPVYASAATYFDFVGCRFKGFVVGSSLCGTMLNTFSGVMSFDNCDFGNVTQRGPYWLTIAAANGRMSPVQAAITSVNRTGGRDFFTDMLSGHAEWNALRSFPTCNARLDDGTTPWSLMVIPSTLSSNLSPSNPFKAPRIGKINTLASGARTFTLEFVAESSLTIDKSFISMYLVYTDVNGDLVALDTFNPEGGAISTSTATWTNEAGGYVTFQNGGTVNHSKYKLTASTPTGKNLPLGAEVSIWVRFHKAVADATKTIFIDPEIVIS